MIIDTDVATMAAVLATTDGLVMADEGQCIMVLHQARYRAADILIWLDEAREQAQDMRAAMAEAAIEEAE